jgi:hypothetical protein
LGFAELASDTPKELTEIVFGVMQRVGRHAQRSGNAAPDAATPREHGLPLSTTLLSRYSVALSNN